MELAVRSGREEGQLVSLLRWGREKPQDWVAGGEERGGY